MDIDKIVLLIYKMSPFGPQVLAWKPNGIDMYFLPNTSSKGFEDKLKQETQLFMKYMGFTDFVIDQIKLDLGTIERHGVHYHCFAIRALPDSKPFNLPFLDDIVYMPLEELLTKLVSPHKLFLQKFTNWTIV